MSNVQLVRDFWSQPTPLMRQMAHWPSSKRWHLEHSWEAIGDNHWNLFEKVLKRRYVDAHTLTMLEWGCGGGCNVVAFSRRYGEIWGVDISRDTLECCSQVARLRQIKFRAVYHELGDFKAMNLPLLFDAFLCTGVLMYSPSKEYNKRLVAYARNRLCVSGLAMFHITESISNTTTSYKGYPTEHLVYTEDEFWDLLETSGFRILLCERQAYHNNLFLVCEKV